MAAFFISNLFGKLLIFESGTATNSAKPPSLTNGLFIPINALCSHKCSLLELQN